MPESEPDVPVEKVGNVQQSIGEFGKLDETGEIDLPEFDPTPFIGKNSMIEFIEERKGEFGFYVKIFSQPIDEGDMQIRASRIFGLQADIDGKIGWGPKTQLGLFLSKYKVSHYKDLLENPVVKTMKDDTGDVYRKITGIPKTAIIIQTRTGKDGKDYLCF